MQSPNNSTNVRELVMLSLLIAIALVLSYFERFIPMNIGVPGVKLGLANVVTLLCLHIYKPSRIYLLIVVRGFLASVFLGSMMSFWYSLTGGLMSGTAMMLTAWLLKDNVSLIGISAIGAIFHNIGQLIVVTVVTGSFYVALGYFPMLLIAGIITGIFIGVVGKLTKPYLVQMVKA